MIRSAIDALEAKAYRLFIATHETRPKIGAGVGAHERTKRFLLDRGWILVSAMPHQKAKHIGQNGCVESAFRGRFGPTRNWSRTAHLRTEFDWTRVLREGCYADTD